MLESSKFQFNEVNQNEEEINDGIEEELNHPNIEKSELGSFATIFQHLYENLFIYNQNPQCTISFKIFFKSPIFQIDYTNPTELRNILSSQETDEYKENAIIDYIKQNLNPSFL